MARLEEDFTDEESGPTIELPPDPIAQEPEAVAPTPVEAPVEEPEAEDQPQPGDDEPVAQGRLRALLAERDKRQAAEAKARSAEERIAALERQYSERTPASQQRAAPEEIPDPVMDPSGYNAYWQSQRLQDKMQMSGVIASEKYGLDVVKAAETALKAEIARNPALAAEVNSQPHPYEYAVKWHKRQGVLQGIGDADSLDALVEREAARLGYVKVAGQGGNVPAQVIAAPRVQTPPPSMARVAAARQTDRPIQMDDVESKLFGKK